MSANYIGAKPVWSATNTSGFWTLTKAKEMKDENKWPREPDAPTNLAATGSDAEIALTWTAPVNTYGNITNYAVEYTPAGGSPTVVLTNSTTESYTVTGLTNDTEYTFRVAAINHTQGDYSVAATGTPGGGGGWDISTAAFVQSFAVGGKETQPTGIFIKPDGTKMYVTGYASDNVNEYSLGAPWDISTASFSDSFSLQTQTSDARAIYFSPDGAKLFVADLNNGVYSFGLSTPWSIATASYLEFLGGPFYSYEGLYFKPDGMSFFLLSRGSSDVYEYSLQSAWTLSGGSLAKQIDLQSIGGADATELGLTFKNDGTSFFVTYEGPDTLEEYEMSTPWDITTAAFLRSLSTAGQDATMQSPFFKPDGSALYIVGRGSDRVYQYSL